MRSRPPPPAPRPLLAIAEDLLSSLDPVRRLRTRPAPDPAEALSLLLGTKLVPELRKDGGLPVFVGIQGGTNTGKSTVFNALAGKLLSPSVVVASATKHPLIYLHDRWRGALLESEVFPGIVCVELGDPRDLISAPERTDAMYVRFHDDPRLVELAILDSPDFDSTLVTNAEQAARIAAMSDVTLFVTTAQKYRDRVLVEELRRLLSLKSRIIVVFNQVDEEIVFATLLDDLRAELSADAESIEAVWLPRSSERHPEEELRDALTRKVLDPLALLRAADVKPATLQRTVRGILDLLGRILSSYAVETVVRGEVMEFAATRLEDAMREYETRFRLGFPEETIVIRKALGLTEIGPRLRISPEVERASRSLRGMGATLRHAGDLLRRILVRLCRGDEGAIDDGPAALAEYSAARDKEDAETVVRLVEGLRVRVENFVRERETVSALARELLHGFFTPSFASGLEAETRAAHALALRRTGETGEEIVPAFERWSAGHAGTRRAIFVAANTLKIGAGLALAWSLPPSQGILGILSPLKWLYFAAGYFVACYVVAFLVCLRLRRKKRLVGARLRAAREALRSVFLGPLEKVVSGLVPEEGLRRIEALGGELAARPGVAGKATAEGHARGDA